MKNVLVITVLVVFLVLSCNNDFIEDVSVNATEISSDTGFVALDTSDMQSISLRDYNLNLTIKLPVVATAAGAEIKPEIVHVDGDYLWYIKIGNYFNLVIEDYANEQNKVQKHEQQLAAQKDVFTVEFIEKTTDLLFYKRELVNDNGGLPTFHCYAEVEIDGYNYVLRSETFGGHELVIKDMVSSIKTALSYVKSKKTQT